MRARNNVSSVVVNEKEEMDTRAHSMGANRRDGVILYLE